MNVTPFYEIPIYEPEDELNMIDGYNAAMLRIDEQLKIINNQLRLIAKGIDITEAENETNR